MPLPLPRFMARARQRAAHRLHEQRRDPAAFARTVARDDLDRRFLAMHKAHHTTIEAKDKADHLAAAAPVDRWLAKLGPVKSEWLRREIEANPGLRVAVVGLEPVPPKRHTFVVYDDIVTPDGRWLAGARREFLRVLQARARSLVKVRRSASTWRWECPGCGWYMDERADYEGMEEPGNGETAESIAAQPFCHTCDPEVKPDPAPRV